MHRGGWSLRRLGYVWVCFRMIASLNHVRPLHRVNYSFAQIVTESDRIQQIGVELTMITTHNRS